MLFHGWGGAIAECRRNSCIVWFQWITCRYSPSLGGCSCIGMAPAVRCVYTATKIRCVFELKMRRERLHNWFCGCVGSNLHSVRSGLEQVTQTKHAHYPQTQKHDRRITSLLLFAHECRRGRTVLAILTIGCTVLHRSRRAST